MCLLEMFNSITWEHCIPWQMPTVPLTYWTIRTDTCTQYTCVCVFLEHTPTLMYYYWAVTDQVTYSKGCPLQLHHPSNSTAGHTNACTQSKWCEPKHTPIWIMGSQLWWCVKGNNEATQDTATREHPAPACPLSTHHPTKQNYLNRFLDFDGFSWLVDPLG